MPLGRRSVSRAWSLEGPPLLQLPSCTLLCSNVSIGSWECPTSFYGPYSFLGEGQCLLSAGSWRLLTQTSVTIHSEALDQEVFDVQVANQTVTWYIIRSLGLKGEDCIAVGQKSVTIHWGEGTNQNRSFEGASHAPWTYEWWESDNLEVSTSRLVAICLLYSSMLIVH